MPSPRSTQSDVFGGLAARRLHRRHFLVLSLIALVASAADTSSPKAKVEIDPRLPNVLLLGDSISIGYTPLVRERLHGKANVVRPMSGRGAENCRETRTGLARIDAWLGTQKWDVIHFNWGLWDLCYRNPESKVQGNRDKVHGKLTTPLPEYEKNLEQLVTRLERTGAKLIWANTTAVPENEEGRFPADVETYNAAAARVMKKQGVATDDLFTLTKDFGGRFSKEPNDVHYTDEGYGRIAAQVVAAIEAALPSRR